MTKLFGNTNGHTYLRSMMIISDYKQRHVMDKWKKCIFIFDSLYTFVLTGHVWSFCSHRAFGYSSDIRYTQFIELAKTDNLWFLINFFFFSVLWATYCWAMASVNSYTNRRDSPHLGALAPISGVNAVRDRPGSSSIPVLPPIHSPEKLAVNSYSDNRLMTFRLENRQKELLMKIMYVLQIWRFMFYRYEDDVCFIDMKMMYIL